MCLAVPGKLIECSEGAGVVDLQGNRLRITTVLTPDAVAGDWVLVHAGFAITQIDEQEALTTWDYLKGVFGDDLGGEIEEAGDPVTDAGDGASA